MREAIKRLEQANLVSVSHGAATRVLDWRANAGLDLLPDLASGGQVLADPDLILSVLEMRRCVGVDAARLCALRAGDATIEALHAGVEHARALAAAGGGPRDLADHYDQFWRTIVQGSGNVAYRLADNTLIDAFVAHRELTVELSTSEIMDAGAQQEARGRDRRARRRARGRERARAAQQDAGGRGRGVAGATRLRLAPADELRQPATRCRTSSNPSGERVGRRSRPARTCASRCAAPTRPSTVRIGAELVRQDVKTAMRPPGVSTRAMWSSATNGSAKRWRAAKQQTASKLASRKGNSTALPRMRADVGERIGDCRARRAGASSARRFQKALGRTALWAPRIIRNSTEMPSRSNMFSGCVSTPTPFAKRIRITAATRWRCSSDTSGARCRYGQHSSRVKGILCCLSRCDSP